MPGKIENWIAFCREKRDAAEKAALKAIDEFGEHVLGDAQQLCPVDTGFLQASGTTEPAELSGDEVTKKIGFDADYAVFVHENLTAKHAVGQAKFLETAIRQNVPKLNAFMEKRLNPAMEES